MTIVIKKGVNEAAITEEKKYCKRKVCGPFQAKLKGEFGEGHVSQKKLRNEWSRFFGRYQLLHQFDTRASIHFVFRQRYLGV